MANTEEPNLILMDINMADLDGYEVTTRLKGTQRFSQVPIVAVTAKTLTGDKERALVAGCDGYLPKPIDVNQFPQQISAYLSGYRETLTPTDRINYLTEYNHQIVEHLVSKVTKLREANEALSKLEKMKSNFIVLTAHELRTPLTTAYGYSRLLHTTQDLQDEDGRDDKTGFLAERIFASISRLSELVNEILNIALIEANQVKLDLKAVSLEKVINAALIELDPWGKGRDLAIDIDPPLAKLPAIEGDEDRLHQVFWNLLSNAIKYTSDGGAITIDSHAGETYVQVCIRDTGIGIPAEEQKFIFEKFYAATDINYHSTSKVDFKGGGLGIGLSIAKGIVTAHRGKIWLEDNQIDGVGTTFYVMLPLAQAYIPPYA